MKDKKPLKGDLLSMSPLDGNEEEAKIRKKLKISNANKLLTRF